MENNRLEEENLDMTEDEEIVVIDGRTQPFTSIPRTGVVAIREGELDVKEISVYVVMNMMVDGMIKVSSDYPNALAKFTGLSKRQVINVYHKLAEKGLLTIDGEHVSINE